MQENDVRPNEHRLEPRETYRLDQPGKSIPFYFQSEFCGEDITPNPYRLTETNMWGMLTMTRKRFDVDLT
jgi:hypothetical protein